MTFSDQSTISAHYDTEHGQPTRRRRAERGTGNHECGICGKKYSTKQMLRFHQANMHGLGKVQCFSCDICSRTFNQKGALKTHLSTIHRQGDVIDFNCDICNKVFTRKASCEKHMATVHSVGDWKTHTCEVCGKVFGQKSHRDKHMAGVHGVRHWCTLHGVTVIRDSHVSLVLDVFATVSSARLDDCTHTDVYAHRI